MILVIADLHLSANFPSITNGFKHFLANDALQAESLYILGDFFDYWLGDDAMSDFEREIAGQLAKLHQAGIKVYLMHGNRDFLLGDDFCKLAGCELIAEPYVIKNHNILLLHGDILCTKDIGYLRMRKILRSKLGLWILRRLPLNWRQKLAIKLRNQSKIHTKIKDQQIMDVDAEAVRSLMQQYNVDVLIHGHTHRPNTHHLADNKRRLVVGDWQVHKGWKITITNWQIVLDSFTF